jgi:hypothetical protein
VRRRLHADGEKGPARLVRAVAAGEDEGMESKIGLTNWFCAAVRQY